MAVKGEGARLGSGIIPLSYSVASRFLLLCQLIFVSARLPSTSPSVLDTMTITGREAFACIVLSSDKNN